MKGAGGVGGGWHQQGQTTGPPPPPGGELKEIPSKCHDLYKKNTEDRVRTRVMIQRSYTRIQTLNSGTITL